MMRWLILPMLALLLSGCGATVVGPAQVEGAKRNVYLLEHGRHSSLLLTAADQTRLRYAYADWAWYVDDEAGLRTGFNAMLRQSRAALGRQRLPAAQPGERLASVVGVGIQETHIFEVEAKRVDALIDSLESLFYAHADAPHHSASRNLTFVEHPEPYTFSRNSNHRVADWLREVGVTVDGNPAVGRWQVER